MWPRVLRFVVALIVAAVLWYNLTPLYDAFIAAAATPLVKIDPRLRGAHLAAADRIIKVTGSVPASNIPADQLTYYVILLVALFASNRKPLRDRNVVARRPRRPAPHPQPDRSALAGGPASPPDQGARVARRRGETALVPLVPIRAWRFGMVEMGMGVHKHCFKV